MSSISPPPPKGHPSLLAHPGLPGAPGVASLALHPPLCRTSHILASPCERFAPPLPPALSRAIFTHNLCQDAFGGILRRRLQIHCLQAACAPRSILPLAGPQGVARREAKGPRKEGMHCSSFLRQSCLGEKSSSTCASLSLLPLAREAGPQPRNPCAWTLGVWSALWL
jgi:hypothetical protein